MVQLFHCWRCEGVVVARRYPLWSGKKKCWGISTVGDVGDSSFIQGDTSFTRPWSLECFWIYHDLAAVYLCGFHNLYVLYKYNIITCIYIYIMYIRISNMYVYMLADTNKYHRVPYLDALWKYIDSGLWRFPISYVSWCSPEEFFLQTDSPLRNIQKPYANSKTLEVCFHTRRSNKVLV